MIPVLLAMWALTGASAYNATFERGIAAYERGDFAASIEAFEQLIAEDVVSPYVFYNLGNAYRRQGRLGPAIANYERALYLDPAFENAAVNLSQCRQLTKGQFEQTTLPSWDNRLQFLDGVAPNTARALALFFWLAFWILLGTRRLLPLRYLRRAAITVGIFAVAFGLAAWAKSQPPLLGIVSVSEVAARSATNEKADSRFVLNEGDRVLVEKRELGWCRVGTSDGGRGWVPENAVALVGPPYERPSVSTADSSHPENAT